MTCSLQSLLSLKLFLCVTRAPRRATINTPNSPRVRYLRLSVCPTLCRRCPHHRKCGSSRACGLDYRQCPPIHSRVVYPPDGPVGDPRQRWALTTCGRFASESTLPGNRGLGEHSAGTRLRLYSNHEIPPGYGTWIPYLVESLSCNATSGAAPYTLKATAVSERGRTQQSSSTIRHSRIVTGMSNDLSPLIDS